MNHYHLPKSLNFCLSDCILRVQTKKLLGKVVEHKVRDTTDWLLKKSVVQASSGVKKKQKNKKINKKKGSGVEACCSKQGRKNTLKDYKRVVQVL